MTIDDNRWQLKNTNFLAIDWSSISNINRLIVIDWYRLPSIVIDYRFHRLITPGLNHLVKVMTISQWELFNLTWMQMSPISSKLSEQSVENKACWLHKITYLENSCRRNRNPAELHSELSWAWLPAILWPRIPCPRPLGGRWTTGLPKQLEIKPIADRNWLDLGMDHHFFGGVGGWDISWGMIFFLHL